MDRSPREISGEGKGRCWSSGVYIQTFFSSVGINQFIQKLLTNLDASLPYSFSLDFNSFSSKGCILSESILFSQKVYFSSKTNRSIFCNFLGIYTPLLASRCTTTGRGCLRVKEKLRIKTAQAYRLRHCAASRSSTVIMFKSTYRVFFNWYSLSFSLSNCLNFKQ